MNMKKLPVDVSIAKRRTILMLCAAMVAMVANISAQNKYEMRCWIVGDSLKVNVDYVSEKEFPEVEDYFLLTQVANIKTISTGCIGYTFHNDGDTVRFDNLHVFSNPHLPKYIKVYYTLPLSSFRTADGAIVLRREGNWYPHRNGELLTAKVSIEADDYYLIGGSETSPSFDLHLVLLPKNRYKGYRERNAPLPFLPPCQRYNTISRRLLPRVRGFLQFLLLLLRRFLVFKADEHRGDWRSAVCDVPVAARYDYLWTLFL